MLQVLRINHTPSQELSDQSHLQRMWECKTQCYIQAHPLLTASHRRQRRNSMAGSLSLAHQQSQLQQCAQRYVAQGLVLKYA